MGLMSFLVSCTPQVPEEWMEYTVAAKTLGVSVQVTENAAGAPTPQQILVAISGALGDPSFNTAAPWTAVITVTSS